MPRKSRKGKRRPRSANGRFTRSGRKAARRRKK